MWPRALNAARNSAAVNSPPCPTGVNCTPALAAPAPDSCQTMCVSWPSTTSSPGRVRILSAIWFAIVPLGRKTAASLPSKSAMLCCKRLTEGSSPYWSSPTSASAMARRMPGEGLVTVSERRSMSSILQLLNERQFLHGSRDSDTGGVAAVFQGRYHTRDVGVALVLREFGLPFETLESKLKTDD